MVRVIRSTAVASVVKALHYSPEPIMTDDGSQLRNMAEPILVKGERFCGTESKTE